jgi:hypothetical protein
VDGCFGAVEVPEGGLPEAASHIMARFGSMDLKRRVAFWEGRRLNEVLYSSDLFCIIDDGGTIVDAQGAAQADDGESERPRANVRPDCPFAPHDGSCGHQDTCQSAHRGSDCRAARPLCPACFDEVHPSAVPDLVSRIRRASELVGRCSSCEQLSFRFDTDLICDVCQWFEPDVNDELADRFAGNGGSFAPQSGQCPGCSQQMPQLPGPFTFGCPKCGQSIILTLDSLQPGTTVTTMCPNRECGLFVRMPPTIWCQVCGQNLRPLHVVRKLTLEANDTRLAARSDVREDESVRLARRLAEAAESSLRNYAYLNAEQLKLWHNNAYLDSCISSAAPLVDWIRDVVEVRAAGHELYRDGGMRAMQEVHQRVMELGLSHRGAAREIERCWDGIGSWLG